MFKPFNKNFWLFTALMIIATIAIGLINDVETSYNILIVVQIIDTIIYIIYKICLVNDKKYRQICIDNDLEFSTPLIEFLPLQLCNYGYILFPIALITRNQAVIAFCSFIFPFCTFMAICMPCIGFENYSLKEGRIWGFFISHYLLCFTGLAFWSSGIYQPQISDCLYIFIIMIVLSIISHIANKLIRKYTSHKKANYLFTMGSNGNVLLQFFRNIIDIDLIYLYPIAFILCVIFALIILVVK